MAKSMRLDKLLGHCGWGTRRQMKELCKGGHVFVNGQCCRDSAAKVDPEEDQISVYGTTVVYEAFYYLMMNKPAGVLSATEDRCSRTVLDLLPQQYQGAGLFPVGRLDKDTTGLLLLTNDGVWAHRITAPKKHIDKIYIAEVDGSIPDDIDDIFQGGIVLADGMQCLPARARKIDEQTVEVTVQEGKFHQVKRMCAAVGLSVRALRRHTIGGLRLDETLRHGEFRPLREEEREFPFMNK